MQEHPDPLTDPDAPWRSQAATDAQKRKLRFYGCSFPDHLTKGEASELIDDAMASIAVYPPGQLLLIDNYVRSVKPRRKRWVFHLEIPRRGEPMSWSKFQRAAKRYLGDRGLKSPRTKAIRDVRAADGLLALWTVAGRVSRRR